MTTNKAVIHLMAEICHQYGIRQVVVCPGSRSAPLVLAFTSLPDMQCMVIPDERTAAYVALGMAQQLNQPAIVICTSGTAVLNTISAYAEAKLQQVKLLLLWADRPENSMYLSDNQSLDLEGIFGYDLCVTLNAEATDKNALKVEVEAVQMVLEKMEKVNCPAIINLFIKEPLYHLSEPTFHAADFEKQEFDFYPPDDMWKDGSDFEEYLEQIPGRKMVIVGTCTPSNSTRLLLDKLAKREDVVILTESTSNYHGSAFSQFDLLLQSANENLLRLLAPEVVITVGGQVVSKRIRDWLRKVPNLLHGDAYHQAFLGKRDFFETTEPQVSFSMEIETDELLEMLINQVELKNGYQRDWKLALHRCREKAQELFGRLPFSDMKVFETLIASFPAGSNVQYGNSTPVRYSNIFPSRNDVTVNCNRGLSGIDGCVSTAAGAAWINQQLTICVVGDQTFFYDSNALWHQHVSPLLRIIVINNGGGNIFRLINQPERIPQFEKYFEAKHQRQAKPVAEMYGLAYYACKNMDELKSTLPVFYSTAGNQPALLEIFTDGESSAAVYKQFLQQLSDNNQ